LAKKSNTDQIDQEQCLQKPLFSIFSAKKENLDTDAKAGQAFLRVLKNESEYQEDCRRNKNHFKSASRREKTKEK
jgi:hypothetical protein